MDNDLRYPAHAHDAPDHIEHDDAPVATETPKPFAVLEEPTWLDAEDDEELEEPRDSAFRGIWIGIAAAAVTFVLVFAVPHWLGWYDTYWAMIVPWSANVFSVFLVTQFFRSLPRDFLEAAQLDGCGHCPQLETPGRLLELLAGFPEPALAAA